MKKYFSILFIGLIMLGLALNGCLKQKCNSCQTAVEKTEATETAQ